MLCNLWLLLMLYKLDCYLVTTISNFTRKSDNDEIMIGL